MKIIFTLAIATFLMAGFANAQTVNIGVKGGLNVYNINDDDNSAYDAKPGFNVGLLGHIHLSKQIALQPELVYSGQGAKYDDATGSQKLNLGYINVPVLVQYMFDNGFRLQAGPQVGFLVNAKSKVNDISEDVKDDLNKVDFGIGAGLGYVHPPTGLGIDARYNLGLSDISKDNSVKSTNRGFQIGIFYLFNHKN